jgi:hypothetical protein
MGWFSKKKNNERVVEKISLTEIESDNQQNPDKIYNDEFGKEITLFKQKTDIHEDLEVINGSAINEALIMECINKIDKIYYTINLEIKDYIKDMILKHPEFCFILLDRTKGEIVGYLYCLALNELGTVNFLMGNETFENMSENIFADTESEGLFNLNVSEFAVLPEYQNNKTYQSLFSGLVKALTEQAAKHRYVNYSFIEISNIFEREFAKAMNYDIVNDTSNSRKMAGAKFDVNQFENIVGFEELKAAYETEEAKQYLALQQDYNYLFSGKVGRV